MPDRPIVTPIDKDHFVVTTRFSRSSSAARENSVGGPIVLTYYYIEGGAIRQGGSTVLRVPDEVLWQIRAQTRAE